MVAELGFIKLSFKPMQFAGKEGYNNDFITFFLFVKPLCDNVMQPSPLCGSGWLQHIITLRLGKCKYTKKNVLSL